MLGNFYLDYGLYNFKIAINSTMRNKNSHLYNGLIKQI